MPSSAHELPTLEVHLAADASGFTASLTAALAEGERQSTPTPDELAAMPFEDRQAAIDTFTPNPEGD